MALIAVTSSGLTEGGICLEEDASNVLSLDYIEVTSSVSLLNFSSML